MGLIPARVEILKKKLEGFTPDELSLIKSVLLHHGRTRGEMWADLDPGQTDADVLKLVDSATNKAVQLGLLVNVSGQYTFKPSEDWHDYLDEELLSTPAVAAPVSRKKGIFH
jgi:hypothetical protein